MPEHKLHLGGDKYLVSESYQVGGAGKKKKMEIFKYVHGDKQKFLTRDKYMELTQKYENLKHAKAKTDNAKRYKMRNLESNMMNLIPPYETNPAQRRLLEHILGAKNVSEIEMFNTLVHAGLINTDCPPLGQPERTEKFIDPITGRKQCREPTPLRRVAKSQEDKLDKPCPNKQSGDPFATEKYIDWEGNVTCRRPVIRGAFFCPQRGSPLKTESVVLPDGTGICTEKEMASHMNRTFPTQVIYPDSSRLSLYESVFNTVNMTPELVTRVNSLFRSSKGLNDLRMRVESDPGLAWLNGAINHMRTDDDIKVTNVALYRYIQKNMPDYLNTIVGEKGSAVDGYLQFFGISSPRQLVLGGAKKSAKKPAKSAKKAAPKAAKSKPKQKSTKSTKSSSSAKSSF
jgi:hypothetical protein